MGYRNYLYVIDKDNLEKLKNFKKSDSDEDYISQRDLLKQFNAELVFEFGKDVEWTKQIKNKFRRIFTDDNINDYFNAEEEFVEIDYTALETIIGIFKDNVSDYYKKLLEEKDIKRFQSIVRDKIAEWRFIEKEPISKYELTSSWKYEYEYFTLLHIVSMINPEKQTLLWLGW